jgi:glycosyltransferase involved in cell wall biosynthesis
VVPPNDLEVLGRRIRELIENPVLAEQMGQAAREHVRRRFSWPAVAQRGLDFYRELHRKARGSNPNRAR